MYCGLWTLASHAAEKIADACAAAAAVVDAVLVKVASAVYVDHYV